MRSSDVVVVGGGAVGCAAAWFLAREGVQVTLVERDELAGQASGAAAGMLAPVGEAEYEEEATRGDASAGAGVTSEGDFGRAGETGSPLVLWGMRSLDSFPELCETLREISGVDPEFEASGLLRLATSESEERRLRAWPARLADCGLEWIDADAARAAAPGIAPDVRGALWSPREAHVRSPLLTQAYAGAARQLGARILTGVPVHGLLRDGDRFVGVRSALGDLRAGNVVVCTGAFSRELGDWLSASGGAGGGAGSAGWAPPVRPIRGQILALDAPRPGFRPILWGPAYLVPKRDGSLVVGATEEEVGFDRKVTAEGIASLLAAARAMVPGLADCGFRNGWAGLRPGSPDGLPAIGPVPGARGLWVAAGHHRNGVLLSPVTGRLLADALTGKALPPEARVFDPVRWGG